MHEHNRLSRALLSGVVVRVVITLVSNVVDSGLVLNRSVRSENLPVETSIFELHFTVEDLDKVLSNLGGASELSQSDVSLDENLLHDRSIAVDHVHVFLGEATVVHHADPLLEDVRASHVRFDEGFVSHHEGSHVLQNGDLNGEVEGADNTDGSEGESVALRELALVISGVGESTGEETDLISAEVLEESAGDSDLSLSLLLRLGDSTLGALDHPVEDLGVVHNLGSLTADLSEHQVTLFVVVGVVETELGAASQTVDERLNFVHLSVRNGKHGLAGHGVDVVDVLFSTDPFSTNKVLSLVSNGHVPGVESSELVEVSERLFLAHSADTAEDIRGGSRKHFYIKL